MESVNNVMKRYKGLTCFSSQVRHPRGGGRWGGGTPRYVLHQRVGFLRRFGLKTGIDFANLRSGSIDHFTVVDLVP